MLFSPSNRNFINILCGRFLRPEAETTRNRVPEHHLGVANRGGMLRDEASTFFGHFLVSNRLQELAYPKSAGVTGSPSRRKYVVGSDGFVGIGDCCTRAEEERSVVLEP